MDISSSRWVEAIEDSEINRLQGLIKDLRQTEAPIASAIQPHLFRVHKDCIPKVLQSRASTMLGIEFEGADNTSSITMTSLQLSAIKLYTSTTSANRERWAQVVEMLVKVRVP